MHYFYEHRPYLLLDFDQISDDSFYLHILHKKLLGWYRQYIGIAICEFFFMRLRPLGIDLLKEAVLMIFKIFLQITSKWSETRKKHKINNAEFLPFSGAGSQSILPAEKINTKYQTEYHQILTIIVAWVRKGH